MNTKVYAYLDINLFVFMHRALSLSKDNYDFQNIVLVDRRLPLLLIMKYKAVIKGEGGKRANVYKYYLSNTYK